MIGFRRPPKPSGGLNRWFYDRPWLVVWAVAATCWVGMWPHWTGSAGCHSCLSPATLLWSWMLMVCAMMLPLQWRTVETVAFRSYPERRNQSIWLYCLGYLGAWMLPVPFVYWLYLKTELFNALGAGLLFGLGSLWMLSRTHELALRYCHALRPLAPSGRRWVKSHLTLGLLQGAACVVSCFPVMLACQASNHAPSAMILGFALAWYERHSFEPVIKAQAFGYFLLALIFMGKGLL